MAGKLYGIGVGPGDTGLMTLRAKEVLEGCGVIAYPVKKLGEAAWIPTIPSGRSAARTT